jgi:hypothetical protein
MLRFFSTKELLKIDKALSRFLLSVCNNDILPPENSKRIRDVCPTYIHFGHAWAPPKNDFYLNRKTFATNFFSDEPKLGGDMKKKVGNFSGNFFLSLLLPRSKSK